MFLAPFMSRSIHVSIHCDSAMRAPERLRSSKLLMQLPTPSTRHRGICFITDNHLTLPILPCLIYQPLLKSVVAPREHLSGSFAVDLALSTGRHLAGLELGKKNGITPLHRA